MNKNIEKFKIRPYKQKDTAMSIQILVGFDGSSPHSLEGVKKNKKNVFTVYPSWRKVTGIDEEAPGCGSRFYIKINNPEKKIQQLQLTADWATSKRVEHHDYGFIKHESEDEWNPVYGIHNGETCIDYRLDIQLGITEFGLLPAYNYEKLCNYTASIEEKGFSKQVVGTSGEERDILLFLRKSYNPNALNYYIQARDHSYETAGSYCVEGIVEFLNSNSFMSEYLKSKFNFYIMPMTNPDGVYNGLSRLTHENGRNLDRFFWNEENPSSEVDTMLKVLHQLKTAVYINFYNYAEKFIDAILSTCSRYFVDKIIQHLPADNEHHKRWFIMTEDELNKQKNELNEHRKI